MALTLTTVNRIFEKAFAAALYLPQIRRANHFEERINEYGTKLVWVIDQGDYQALTAYPTLNAAIVAVLEHHWDAFDGTQLTDVERRELRAIPSNVARLL